MGYACPVCGAEQADGVHLANHLAVTASLGRADHLAWLDEYAPDWADAGQEELAAVVREYAREVETPEFASGHDHAPSVEDALARRTRGRDREAATAETEHVLAEARELTRRMYESEEVGDANADGERAENENA